MLDTRWSKAKKRVKQMVKSVTLPIEDQLISQWLHISYGFASGVYITTLVVWISIPAKLWPINLIAPSAFSMTMIGLLMSIEIINSRWKKRNTKVYKESNNVTHNDKV